MSALSTAVFILLFVVGCFRPALAFALLLFMFPVEQVLQGANPILVGSPLGRAAVNIAICLVALSSVSRMFFTRAETARGFFNSVLSLTLILLVWSAVTVTWSPSQQAAIGVLTEGAPYYLATLVLGTLLVTDIESLAKCLRTTLLIGTLLCLFIVLSPDFSSRWGRLGIGLGGGFRSNPLALGEAGGLTVICAALLRSQVGASGAFWNSVRLLGFVVGVVVGALSGSRGQVLFAVAVSAIMFPVATQLRSFRVFVITALGLTIVVLVTSIIFDLLLSGFEAQRFSLDSLLYGQSSTLGRVQNVILLFQAWANSPLTWIFGLGFYAFQSLFSSSLDPYSHVIIADIIFEHGLIGAGLGAWLLVEVVRSARFLFRRWGADSEYRAYVVAYVGLCVYVFLLANKQGNLWGMASSFLILGIGARVRARDHLEVEPDSFCESESYATLE